MPSDISQSHIISFKTFQEIMASDNKVPEIDQIEIVIGKRWDLKLTTYLMETQWTWRKHSDNFQNINTEI
jgi:hypothetical protein